MDKRINNMNQLCLLAYINAQYCAMLSQHIIYSESTVTKYPCSIPGTHFHIESVNRHVMWFHLHLN